MPLRHTLSTHLVWTLSHKMPCVMAYETMEGNTLKVQPFHKMCALPLKFDVVCEASIVFVLNQDPSNSYIPWSQTLWIDAIKISNCIAYVHEYLSSPIRLAREEI